MCSSKPAPRRFIGTPAATNSCSIHPCPMPTTSRPALSRSRVASRRARRTGPWNRESSTLVPSVIRVVVAATYVRTSIGSYTVPNISGASITGPPGPPIAIGTVGRSCRSNDHTESSPARSASWATWAMASGEASGPATGRCTPILIAVILVLPARSVPQRSDSDRRRISSVRHQRHPPSAGRAGGCQGCRVKTFDDLFAELADRAAERPAGSGTVALLDAGVHAIGKKVVEEAAEVWMAAEHEGPERTAEEVSQLLYHLQVLLLARGLTLDDVYRHL